MFRLRFGWFLFPLILFFMIGCRAERPVKEATGESGRIKKAKRPVAVTALTVTSREIPFVVKASGKTQSSDRFEAKAFAKVKVQKVFVEEGDRVEAGGQLMKLDDEEIKLRLGKARAEVREAEAAVDHVRFLQQNRDKLIEEGKVSKTEAEGFEGRINLHQATINRARAEIDLYEKDTGQMQINSPITGLVTHRFVSEGNEVKEEQPLIEVVKMDPMLFVFNVPIKAVSSLEKEAEISVRFAGLGGQELTAHTLSVGAQMQEASEAVEVKLTIPNPDFVLKTEMKGDVVIHTKAKKKIFLILETALIKTERSNYLYKIEGGKLKRVPVELGESYNGQPVVEKGLNEGDQVVISSEEDLADGMAVEIEKVRAER